MQDSRNPYGSDPGMMDPTLNMQAELQPQYFQGDGMSIMPVGMENQVVYPEVFYKLQPFIMMICDQMENLGYMIPTQQMVEQMTDSIYDDVTSMYPEMADYVRRYDQDDQPVAEVFSQFPGRFDRDRGFMDRDRGFPMPRFRRRGLFRDLIDILILSELFNRRRRFFDF